MERTNAHDPQAATEKDVFIHTWKKDFHVSPFNDRDGNYALEAIDSFAPDMLGEGRIGNAITLSSSEPAEDSGSRLFF